MFNRNFDGQHRATDLGQGRAKGKRMVTKTRVALGVSLDDGVRDC